MHKLREIRKARGLTQQQLADMVGILNVSLSNYERGTQQPDIETILKIANTLGVSVDALLDNEPADEVQAPRTVEARILATGIDKLPQQQREQALELMKIVFAQHAEYFERSNANDET